MVFIQSFSLSCSGFLLSFYPFLIQNANRTCIYQIRSDTLQLPSLGFPPYLDEIPIPSRLVGKCLVAAALDDPAVIYDQNLIGLLDRREAVGDRDDRVAPVDRPSAEPDPGLDR